MSTYYSYFQKSRKTRTTFASQASDGGFVEQNYMETKKVVKPSVARQSSDGHTTIGWLSGNFFRRFNQNGKILKKVAERSRDSRWRSRDSRRTVRQLFTTFRAIRNFFLKSRWSVTQQSLNADLFDRAESTFVQMKFDE